MNIKGDGKDFKQFWEEEGKARYQEYIRNKKKEKEEEKKPEQK